MLGVWTAQGYPGYPWDNPGQHIMYISTLGATGWGKPLFITGSTVMVVLFNATFCMERWFRHKGRLVMNYNITEKILSGFAIAFAIIGGFGLIFLTIFDTRRFPNVHQAMLAVFMYVFCPRKLLARIAPNICLQWRLHYLSDLHLR